MGLLEVLNLKAPAASGLGVPSKPTGRSDSSSPTRLLPVWNAAREAVGQQIGQLQSALRATKDPVMLAIADKGLSGISQRLQVGLHVALIEFDAGDAASRGEAAPKVAAATGEMRKFIDTHPALPLLEKNPLGIQVTIRKSLAEALDTIEKSTTA